MKNNHSLFVYRIVRVVLVLPLIFLFSGAKNEPGEGKKVWSGKSFLKETRVDKRPQLSAAAASGFDSERAWSGYDDWEPASAVDRTSDYVYQMTTRYSGPKACNGCPFPVIIFRSSSNKGLTWNADQFLVISKKQQNDPEIEVASDGTIYALWLDEYTPGVRFLKSTNRGVSWSTPYDFTGRKKTPSWSDKPILAISPDGKDVYVAFNASDSYMVASHDYGQTFSTPLKTNNDTRYWFHYAGAVAPNGTIYFASIDYSQDYTGDANINVHKSTNGGVSWTTTRVDTSREMPGCSWAAGCYFGFFGPTAGLAVDSTGKILLAYNAGNSPGAPQRLYARTSTDGVSWSARVELSNGSATVNNAFPVAASGTSAGDFRVTWQDDRVASQTGWNTWYSKTNNGGATWTTPVRLSDLTSGAPYKNANGYKFPYGDYFEMSVDSDGQTHFIWGEGASYTGPGGTWYTRTQ